MKQIHHLDIFTLNQYQFIIHNNASSIVISPLLDQGFIRLTRDSNKMTFSLKKAILEVSYVSWKQRIEVKNIVMMDLFLTNAQLFILQDIN